MFRMFSDDFLFGIGVGCVIMMVAITVIMVLNAPGCGAVVGG